MKIKNSILNVYKNTASFTDKAYQMGAQSFSLGEISTSDYLYVGYTKKINQLFIELKVVNANTSVISVEQYNGTSWVALPHLDETEGFKRSGFVYFDETANLAKTGYIHEGVSGVWYRLKVNAGTSAINCFGINLVFSNLNDLRDQEPLVERFYPRDLTTHILSLKAARDWILRRINNSQPGYVYGSGDSTVEARDLNQFDILDISELKDASTFYALYKIMSNRSDSDDRVKEKAQEYLDMFNEEFKLWAGRRLTLDLNNDGEENEGEKITANVRTKTAYR